MERKVGVVGAGITGAALAHLLQQEAVKRSLKVVPEVVVWEKNNIAGGRMMARSFRKNRVVHVDIGAQYLTTFTSDNDDVRTPLSNQKLLATLDASSIAQDTRRRAPLPQTICPQELGFRAIVESLLKGETYYVPVQLSRGLEKVEIVDKDHIKLVSASGEEEIVNELVLTCPIPSLLPILEQSQLSIAPEKLQALKAVEYSQRFAVAYLFDASIAQQVHDLGWIVKYITDDEDSIVRYLCWDNLKKQQNEDTFTLLVHTSVPYGVANMETTNDEILATVKKSLKKLLPFLPTEQELILHRWRISQVSVKCQEGDNQTPAMVLSTSPKIVVAGDAFLGSTFDNCLLSAKAAVNLLLNPSTRSGL